MEGVCWQSLELCQADLDEVPEAFDVVDVDGAFGELVAGAIGAEVAIAEIDQVVIAVPAIGVDDGTTESLEVQPPPLPEEEHPSAADKDLPVVSTVRPHVPRPIADSVSVESVSAIRAVN